MYLLITHFRLPPVCPDDLSHQFYHYITHPSTFFALCLLIIVSLIFAILTALFYNRVKVFDTNIRTPNISNNLWIFYFVAILLK